ncbi:MAG: hypothetical protein GF405_02760, partial [Candidatus Eisenbacteria bacterium]|nr:hypothetical protein [Candidatus Eisenbacteria bacterium]
MRRFLFAAAALAAVLCVVLGGCRKLGPAPVAPQANERGRAAGGHEVETASDRRHPETEITLGPQGVACPSVRFRWTGWDRDGEVTGYGYSLHASGEEEPVAFEDDLPCTTTTVTLHELSGTHTFRVWAIDDDGFSDPTPATRTFDSVVELNAPRLVVRPNLLEIRRFRGMVAQSSHNDPIDVFTNVTIEFDWSSTTTCDVLAGYDVAVDDTTTLGDSYDPFLTHFELDVAPGHQTVYIQMADSLGYTTRGRYVLRGYEATHDEYVVVVDDWDLNEASANPMWAGDAERDAFYDALTASCALPVVEWDML